MWDFYHPPFERVLNGRYSLYLTAPADCARQLLEGRADLGLIPVAALTPELLVVPGCTIASLDRVRSIQLIVKAGRDLGQVRTVAADSASRSSLAYAQVLFRKFLGTTPEFGTTPADPVAMLAEADAALVIGDPALLALEDRARIEAAAGPCTWHDVAGWWTSATGLPWVAAVWAVHPGAEFDRTQLIADLNRSRTHGLEHIDDLVNEWTGRIALPAATIREYLTTNIHYSLDERCLAGVRLFRKLAAEGGILPEIGEINLLEGFANVDDGEARADNNATSHHQLASEQV